MIEKAIRSQFIDYSPTRPCRLKDRPSVFETERRGSIPLGGTDMNVYFDNEAYRAKKMAGLRATTISQLQLEAQGQLRISGKKHEALIKDTWGIYALTLRQMDMLVRKSPQDLKHWIEDFKRKYEKLSEYASVETVAEDLMSIFPDVIYYLPLVNMFDWSKDIVSAILKAKLKKEGIEVVSIFS